MTITELQSLQRSLRGNVEDGELSIALKDLKERLPESSKKALTVSALRPMQTKLNEDKSNQVLSTDEARLESSRIVHEVLELINGLEPEDFDAPEPGESTGPTAQMGHILYKIPAKMKVAVEKRCIVRLAFEKKPLLVDLDYDDSTQEGTLRVEREMEVYLVDPSADGEKAFAIRPENLRPRQFLEKGSFTEWIFHVKPLREGTRPLKVFAVIILLDGEREMQKEITFESVVQVTASEPVPEPAGDDGGFQSAGYQFQYQSTAASAASIVYEAPAEPRSKSAAGIVRTMAYTIAAVFFTGLAAYLSYSYNPPGWDRKMAGLKNTPDASRKLMAKYQNDPDPRARRAVETAAYRLAGQTGEVADHQAYLDRYPAGTYSANVKIWVGQREAVAVADLMASLELRPDDPTGSRTTTSNWMKLGRFASDFGPTDRMSALLEAIGKRPDLADEAPALLEKKACLWVKNHPRPGNKPRFLRLFPKSGCLDGVEDPVENSSSNAISSSNPGPNPGQGTGPSGTPGPDADSGQDTGPGSNESGGPGAGAVSVPGQNPGPNQTRPGQNPDPSGGQNSGASTSGKPDQNPEIGTTANPNRDQSGQPPKKDGAAIVAEFEIDMVWVDGGRMQLGNATGPADETKITMPVHEVDIDGFHISKYEVTQAQWRLVMDANPSRHAGCDECPVENISWDDVQLFLQKLNSLAGGKHYRLPAESEWEYVARGGLKSKNFALAGSDDVGEVGWWGSNSGGKSSPVGKRMANELGLFDMSGNAKEWCADPWHDTYQGAPSHSVVWEKGGDPARRVVRGGSFNSPAPPLCRSTARDRQPATARMMTLGFRLARD